MKKTSRYVLFAFTLLIGLFAHSNKIEASGERTNIFDSSLIGTFELESIETGQFNKRNQKYNYTFTYDYRIADDTVPGESYIYDGSSPIITYYGIAYEAGKKIEISYENIADDFLENVRDEFYIYKYNPVSQEFISLANSGVNPDANTYEITEAGIYKLDTLISGIGGKSTYLIYEPYSLNLEFNEDNPFTVTEDVGYLNIEANLIVRELKVMEDACYSGVKIKIGETEKSPTCTITPILPEEGEKFQGYHILKLGFSTTEYVGNSDVVVTYNGRSATSKLVYDYKEPEISKFVYKNSSLLLDGFELEASTSNTLPINSVAVITVDDDSGIGSAKMKYILNEEETTTICSYDSQNRVVVCSIDATKIPGSVTYEIEDANGNVKTIEHTNTYDTTLLPDGETLESHITREENVITTSFEGEGYEDISQVCIFYGEELSFGYECGTSSVTASYYYKGTINVVILDDALNYAAQRLENVEFLNGYTIESYTWDADLGEAPKYNNKVSVTTYLEDLKTVACGSDEDCEESIIVEVKYGDLIESLEGTTLPTFADILNKKYKDSACVNQLCDKTVELILNYNIGTVTQSVSGYVKYTDVLPYFKDTFTFTNALELEYKKFDITATDTIRDLYGDSLNVDLIDKNNEIYLGVISPVFVEYKNRDNEVTKLDNLPYTSIATADKFGVYLLECRIKLLKNVTTGALYQDDIYTKSFFINVELSDKDDPVITLIGESEITVKEHGAYKDPGYRCEDASACTVTVTHYLNDESNPVNKVDTNVIGKYIIKYVAVDGDGNKSLIATRIVNVESTNSFDTTSIIIIVAIVAVLATIITVTVVIEVKKNKKMKDKEDYV